MSSGSRVENGLVYDNSFVGFLNAAPDQLIVMMAAQ